MREILAVCVGGVLMATLGAIIYLIEHVPILYNIIGIVAVVFITTATSWGLGRLTIDILQKRDPWN